MESFEIIKYPRTPHLEGSRLQPGDEDLSQVPFADIAGRHLVVEEKVDGANSAVSFDGDGQLLLQSRGHYLTGGYRERHYALLKQWAAVHRSDLWRVLGSRYIMYGEWLYAKHKVYYDALPHYFLEFDVLDRQTGEYLGTHERSDLLFDLPICSVPVLAEGSFNRKEDLLALLGPSRYVTGRQREHLCEDAARLGIDEHRCCDETELSGMAEGLYLKVEEGGRVVKRLKFVRAEFLQCVDLTETHWLDRPIVPNRLVVPFESLFA